MQRLKNPRVIIVIVAVVLICGILIADLINFVISCKILDEYTQMNIFEDISELDVLKTTEAELTDEYIDGLSVLRSFVHEVEYDSESFEIYAYEFETVEDAKKYMELTRGVSEEKDKEYARHGKNGLTKKKTISNTYKNYVRDKCNLYRIEYIGSNSGYVEVQKYLNSILKIVVRE
jgi:hypothetical protein